MINSISTSITGIVGQIFHSRTSLFYFVNWFGIKWNTLQLQKSVPARQNKMYSQPKFVTSGESGVLQSMGLPSDTRERLHSSDKEPKLGDGAEVGWALHTQTRLQIVKMVFEKAMWFIYILNPFSFCCLEHNCQSYYHTPNEEILILLIWKHW